MPAKWKTSEERTYRAELKRLYIKRNLSICEIAKVLGLAQQTVFQRLERLGIRSEPQKKDGYQNRRSDIRVPKKYTDDLAEFFGIMLGDGHISRYQVVVGLGNKEEQYANYVAGLMERVFGVRGHIAVRRSGYRDVYFGSVDIVKWFLNEGLVHHKVRSQVDIPRWLFSSRKFSQRFVRGFFDTDGSVYQLKFGIQISLSNNSLPLLTSLRAMLNGLGYKASHVSAARVYLTRRGDVWRFFEEIRPRNPKHVRRFKAFWSRAKTMRR